MSNMDGSPLTSKDFQDAEEIRNLKAQIELLTKALKIAKAVAENNVKELLDELGAQRRYIAHIEKRCRDSQVKIFDET